MKHIHLIVTAWIDNPPTSVVVGETWLRELVDVIDMKILMDAKALYCEDLGNEGLTGIVGLTTSHSSFHCWHEVERPYVQVDVYSCKFFDIETVMAHLVKSFTMTSCSYMLIDREEGRNAILDQGFRSF